MTMNPEIKQQWVAALRSGEYRQGKYMLHNVDENTYCCLGVLCDLAVKAGLQVDKSAGKHNEYTVIAYDGNQYSLPALVIEWAGLETDIPETAVEDEGGEPMNVAQLNDRGWSFVQIADVIEREL